MILQCGILFAFLAAGELIVAVTGIPVPSSIIGMLLLTAALKTRVVRISWVDRISDFLVRNLGFFFVPAGVGLMRCLGVIKGELLPIMIATIASTFAIIAVTGWTHQYARRFTSGISRHFSNPIKH
ncbi:CidA/LrgA family protein [Muribaculaceae bacterium Isolate-002 (NCI)]|nr:CidA/LrgA family protein [Muribaculaceae bacterium Isolate-002 (NCI)]